MDPNYSGPALPFYLTTKVADSAPGQAPQKEHAAQRQVTWQQNSQPLSPELAPQTLGPAPLRNLMPFGQRLRNLRLALGWTQSTIAARLSVSRRTVIRHERGHHRTPYVRLPLLLRVRELESVHAQELKALLVGIGTAGSGSV
jgi:DNA-binding XRE family transcriptional regulator